MILVSGYFVEFFSDQYRFWMLRAFNLFKILSYTQNDQTFPIVNQELNRLGVFRDPI